MVQPANNSRDDFSERTKKIVAQRSGFRCAVCGCQTDGPTLVDNGAVSIGDAAHITAASPRGPRYDPSLSPDDRSAPENGLWACKNHHWTIDHDQSRYTVSELLRIKANAEERARLAHGLVEAHGTEISNAILAVRSASERMIGQWRTKYRFNPTEVIELDFRHTPPGGGHVVTWNLAQAAAAAGQAHKLVIAGRPGAGKTIALLQLAERLAEKTEGPVPLIFSVSGWVSSNRDLAAYVVAQLGDAGLSPATVSQLFSTGRLVILLNGWNEAPEAEQGRASEQLNDFLLNHALTGLVLSTRATRHSPRMLGETALEVVPLNRGKKVDIIRAANLSDPDSLLRQVERSRVLAEVTQTPLFLAAAIRLARAGRPIPSTRSGLLQSFLLDLEETDNHATRLRTGPCQDCHYRYQTALAAEMTREGLTILPVERAQATIGTCSTSLIAAGRIGQPEAASAIADCLVRHHALIYSPEAGPGYGFLHQQFQEWFASRWILDEIRRLSVRMEPWEIFALQRDVLNRHAWGEAIGFAMETLTEERATGIAALLVRWMMPVDLIRATELAGTGGAELWAVVGAELGLALRQWHGLAGAHRECALAAMLASGQPDFADLVWPALEEDEQSMFGLCRLHDPFRLKVLGAGWAQRMVRWPEQLESLFLGEIAAEAGEDEITHADLRAREGPAAVRVAALKLMVEHGKYGRVLEILCAREFGEWSDEIYDHVLDNIPAALLVPHGEFVRRKYNRTESFPVRAGIVEFLQRIVSPDWTDLAHAELERAAAALRTAPISPTRYDESNPEMRAILNYTRVLWPTESLWMAGWLVTNFGESLLDHERFARRIESFPEDALVALAHRIVDAAGRNLSRSSVLEYLLGVGSVRVATVFIDAYLTAKLAGQDTVDLPRTSELRRSPIVARVLVDAILARSQTVREYRLLKALVDALSPVTAFDGSLGEHIELRQRDPLRALIKRVSAAIPTDEEARSYRPSLAVLLGSLGVPEDVAVVSGWVADEIVRWEGHRRQVAEAAAARPVRRVAHYGTSWWNWYAGGLALFRCSEAESEFLRWLEHPWMVGEGAEGLLDLSLMDGALPRLPENMSFRRTTILPVRPIGPAVRVRADAIVRAIERLETLPQEDQTRKRLLPVAVAALGRLNDPRAIDRLLPPAVPTIGWTPLGALTCMQARGTVLPGRRMASALEAFISTHEARPQGSNDQWYAVVQALRLLLFSDEPRVGVDRMRRLPDWRMNSYYARDIYVLLADSLAPEAGAQLVEYSRTNGSGELMEALAASRDPRCHDRLLELLHFSPGEIPRRNRSEVSRCVLLVAERDATFRLRLTEAIRAGTVRWARPPGLGPAIGTVEILEATLREADLRPVEQLLQQLIDDLSETREPAGTAGAYYIFPADVTAIKHRLAGILTGGGVNAEVASRLLAFLRLKRVQRGQPASEALHPDITLLAAGVVTWPISLR